MSTKFAKTLSLLLPAGAFGASLLLASTPSEGAVSPAAQEEHPGQAGVANRLKAIRAGVSDLATPSAEGSAEIDQNKDGQLFATWWGNGGWGRWHAGWGNGGWRWGWHNGGWGNGWPNGWHNWGNGWNNWGNGWHNYWHNG
jgi:rSAM-associated Gly-rich repeat protein